MAGLDGIHANWATKIADLLNANVLPPNYHAISLVKRGQEDLFEVRIIRRRSTQSRHRNCQSAADEEFNPH